MEVPIINSYSDIKNTGKTGLITNEQIRKRFTNLELGIANQGNQIDDRLRVQQLRVDAISVDEINFVRTSSLRESEILSTNETQNDYYYLLHNQRIRNLVAIKLNLTNAVIGYRRDLEKEIEGLIALLEKEIGNGLG
jgi:hypothetical protein